MSVPSPGHRPIVVSLSSIPPRFSMLGPVLDSLLAQRLRPSRIVLVIPRQYRRFPDWDGTLPDVPAGVELLRIETDLGPASKILPMALRLRGTDSDLVYCDDDVRLPGHWLRAMRRVAESRPGNCIAAVGYGVAPMAGLPRRPEDLPRAVWLTAASPPDPARQPRAHIQTAGLVDVVMGHGGVMVRPDWFPDAAFEIPPCAWAVDDIWLSGWLAAQGIPLWVDPIIPMPLLRRAVHDTAPLVRATIDAQDRPAANRAAIDWWRVRGVWQPALTDA